MTARDYDFLDATLPVADLLYNLARRCSRTPQEAEDLVQETYLRALKAWREHRRPVKVEPWLATICLNIARSDYRRTTRRPEEVLAAEPGVLAPSGDSTEDLALGRLRRQAVQQLIWQLSEEQRIALTLVDLCGLTAAEAARVTGSPRGTVLSRVHRGRKAFAALAALHKVDSYEA
ncbi:MAG: RNA polymerase sigma factor [Actinomycetota bacterium]